MNVFLIIVAFIILVCVFLNNATFKVGVPVLLAFILFGMLFGNYGLFPIRIENYKAVEQLCSIALIFIMFYGGFGTRWKAVSGVAKESVLLATVGVLLTAALTGLFCHFLLHWGWVESFLLGSVLSSTDAASVFSIMRSRKLGLKNGISSILEVESGSNDPCSYMLTIIMLSLLGTDPASGGRVVWLLFSQLFFGASIGVLIAIAASAVLRRVSFASEGFDSLFLIAVALFAYAIPSVVGGNGFLSAYIVGVVLGNIKFTNKKNLVHFFDGFTGLMQVFIFFVLGLLAHPASLVKCFLPAVAVFLVLLFIARPLASAVILLPFGKYSMRDVTLVSFAGLRGAASIVFAIVAISSAEALQNDIFNVVFSVVLLSIAIQGTLLPKVASKLSMIDEGTDIMKTFSDFSDEVDIQFAKIEIRTQTPWEGRQIKDLSIPKELILCSVIREDGSRVVPVGNTVVNEGDSVIIASKQYSGEGTLNVSRRVVEKGSDLNGKTIMEIVEGSSDLRGRILIVQRGENTIIPHGNTVLVEDDIVFILKG